MTLSWLVRARRTAVAVVAITGMSLVPAVVAAPATAAPPPAAAVPDAAPDETSASLAAKQGKKSVRVDNRTDERTEVRANPNGSFTMTQHTRPVRVKRGNNWVGVDSTLTRNADGTISPRATLVDLAFSPGGKKAAGRPLARAASAGAEVGLSWPGELPEPTMSGSTATYAEVLPGVDLKVTADLYGFSEVLVVKTPEAARNPNLARVSFGSHAKGLKISKVGDGELVATNAKGETVFAGDASRMWDSSGDGADVPRRTATMGVEVTGSTVTIVPDQAFLTDRATKYPVFLDPSYRCVNCGKLHHNVVQSAWPGNHNYDRTDGVFGALMAGHVCDGPCFDARTYLTMNTSALAGRVIANAYLHVDVVHSAYCPGLATSTQLWWVNGMDWNTTWGTQPGWIAHLSSGNQTNNAGHCPNAGGMDLGAKSAVDEAARVHAGGLTLMLKGEREGGGACDFTPPIPANTPCTSWRKFNLNPYLVVDYNSYPNPPADLGIEGWGPNGADALPCVIGNDRPFVGTRTPRLRARLSDPDGGVLDAGFRVYRGTYGSYTWDGNQKYAPAVPSGSFSEVTVDAGVMPADGLYFFDLWAGDGALSTWSRSCEMQVDTVKPGKPTVTSAQYPAGGTAGGVGQTGSFTFAPPSGTNDVAYYTYVFTTQGDVPQTRVNPAALNGPVTVPWTPTLSGPQTLRVRAYDRANNPSNITDYQVVVSDYRVGVSGKVAQWSFDGSPADTAGAKSLTYTGPPPPGGYFGPGYHGQAAQLAPENTEFYPAKDALVRTDAAFTVSAWVNLERTGADYVVAAQDGNRGAGFRLQYDASASRWSFAMSQLDADESGQGTVTRALSGQPPTLYTWTHLAGVYDATARRLLLYIDGTLAGQANLPATPWNATGPFVVGAGKVNGARTGYFAGSIDEVRVHARALTAAQLGTVRAGTDTAGPDAEYLLDGTLDNTGANNNLLPNAAVGYVPGYAGQAAQPPGPFGQLAQTAGPVISTTGSFSVSAWVKLADKSGFFAVASQDGNRVSGMLLRYWPDGDRWLVGMPQVDADGDTFQWAVGQRSPQVNVWTHLTVVHDAPARRLLLYVDGVLEGQRDLTATIDARGPFVLGSWKYNGVRDGFWSGSVDEVNVYDGALSAAEVAGLANVPVERARYSLNETTGSVALDSLGGPAAPLYGDTITWGENYGAASARFTGTWNERPGTVVGPGPLGRWSMDQNTTDSSGNGRNLVHRNNSGPTPVTYTPSTVSWGAQLNGTDQWMSTTGPVVDTTRSYSMSAWVRLDRNNVHATVLAQTGNVSSPFILKYDLARNRWVFMMTDGDRMNPIVAEAMSSLPPLVGRVTHLLGVYDAAAGKIRLYVNSRLEAEVAATPTWPSAGPFEVGRVRWNNTSVQHFPGVVDEIRAYDRVLTATDARALWDLGSHIDVPRPDAFRTDRSFTVAAWVRADGYDSSARQAIAVAADRYSPFLLGYRGGYQRWSLMYITGSEAAPVESYVLSDNVASSYATVNGWVHLAAVYDAPNKRVSLYVNGARQLTKATSGSTVAPDPNVGTNVTLLDSGRDLLVGRAVWEGRPVDYWSGAIRDVRIFSGVLPESCDNGAPACLSQLPTQ